MVFIHEAKQRVAAYAKNPVDHFVDKLVSRKNRFGHNIFAFFSSPNSIVVEPKLAWNPESLSSSVDSTQWKSMLTL